MAETNLNVPTGAQLEEMMTRIWQAMKVWVMTNIDQSDLMTQVKQTLDACNRQVIGATATEKADAILASINSIAAALRSAGAVVTDETTLSQFAQLVESVASRSYEICLLGKSGTHYSAAEWLEYIDEHGTAPEEAVPAVITPFQSFVIAAGGFSSRAWGNTTDSPAGLYNGQNSTFIDVLQDSLNFHSLDNTYRMLLWYNPEVLPHANYDPSDPTADYGDYGCVRFATKAEMEASGQQLPYDKQVYIVTNDESDNTTNQEYYWNGSAYVKRFAVPRYINNITGSPAAEFAWNYKAWQGDTRQWAMPTINHMLMMYVYYSQINTCLSAYNRSPLPTGYSWACQQNGADYAYYVTIPSGSVNYYVKNYTSAVVPVAAL